jgi:hypothetical protein
MIKKTINSDTQLLAIITMDHKIRGIKWWQTCKWPHTVVSDYLRGNELGCPTHHFSLQYFYFLFFENSTISFKNMLAFILILPPNQKKKKNEGACWPGISWSAFPKSMILTTSPLRPAQTIFSGWKTSTHLYYLASFSYHFYYFGHIFHQSTKHNHLTTQIF